MDLTHALLRWQQGGLRLGLLELASKRFEPFDPLRSGF